MCAYDMMHPPFSPLRVSRTAVSGKALLRPRVAAQTLPRCRALGAASLGLNAAAVRPAFALEALPTAPTRNLSFSFPGPRKLADITNLPLLEQVRRADG